MHEIAVSRAQIESSFGCGAVYASWADIPHLVWLFAPCARLSNPIQKRDYAVNWRMLRRPVVGSGVRIRRQTV